ncbi:MAG: GNAT family N-acetyltransferase [Oscillospiraceae bacterium]|nr:GNAT family N-acetyltransferase [Oscillospiraceae bacterium]
MELRMGNETDKEYILNIRPQAASLFDGRSYFIIAEDESILGFAVVFHRDIEASVPANEAFINLIEILDENNYRKGIASRLVQKIIEMEEEKNTYQVRAYCEINNIASHRLWFKNGFGISPAKESDGQILGSFVTYVCKQ